MEDWQTESQTNCDRCGTSFSLIKRKHVCRSCNKIVCQNCSSRQIHINNSPYNEPVRVCDDCFVRIKNGESGNSSTSFHSSSSLSLSRSMGRAPYTPPRTLKSPPISPIRVGTTAKAPQNEEAMGCCTSKYCDNDDDCCYSCFWLMLTLESNGAVTSVEESQTSSTCMCLS